MKGKRSLLLAAVLLAMTGLLGLFYLATTPAPSHGGKSVRYWVRQVGHPQGSLSETVEAFQKMGPSALPFLVRSLKAEESQIKRAYGYFYPRFPRWARNNLPSPQIAAPEIRKRAAEILGKMEPPAAGAVPHLIQALRDENAQVRMDVVIALRYIGPHIGEKGIDALTRALADRDLFVQLNACDALGKLGPLASVAEPELSNLLTHPLSVVQDAAASALRDIQKR